MFIKRGINFEFQLWWRKKLIYLIICLLHTYIDDNQIQFISYFTITQFSTQHTIWNKKKSEKNSKTDCAKFKKPKLYIIFVCIIFTVASYLTAMFFSAKMALDYSENLNFLYKKWEHIMNLNSLIQIALIVKNYL